MDFTSHHHSLPHLSTPIKLMRKLSHSKIVVHHLPHLIKNGDPICPQQSQEEEDPEALQMKEIPKDLPTKLKRLPGGKYMGLIFAFLTSITMSLLTLIVKSMNQYHSFSLVLWRLQGIVLTSFLLLSYIWCGSGKKKIGFFDGIGMSKWKIMALIVARGVLGCSADIFQYCSLKYLTLSDSSVIAFSTPIFVTFVAYFTLGEKLGWIPILSGLLSLVGVVVISRPPMLTGEESFDTDILIGNGLALCCMGMATLTFVVIRTLKSVHFSLTTFSYGFIGSLEALVLCGVTSTWEIPQNTNDWILVFSIAGLCLLGQIFLTLALQLEDAGPVALVRSCDVIFAYLWQYLFLNIVPDSLSVIGGIMVITGVMITALRKFIQELPADNTKRKKLSFLLK